MTLLTKDQILKADDRSHEDVDVPEWGGSVRLIAMAACERDAFEASMLNSKGKGDKQKLKNFRARFISRCIVDADNNCLFSDKDLVELGKKSAAPISRIFDICQRLNGMTDKDVEELEGN